MATFREKFSKLPSGPEREELVYQEAIKMGTPITVPITVDGPNGTKITYKVMPRHLNVSGLTVPMTGATAQRIADYFKMHLPTAKMSTQIFDAAKLQGNALVAKPLSGTGIEIDGKHYTGQGVVDRGVDNTDFALAYNDVVDRQLSSLNAPPGTLTDGPYKTIIQSDKPGYLGLHGFYDKNGKPIQGGTGVTPHSTTDHTEYGSTARFVSPEVIVTAPDGRVITTTLDNLMKHPKFYSAVSFSPGVKKYNVKPVASEKSKLSQSAGPPSGYTSATFPTQEIKSKVQAKAKSLLNQDMWTVTPFEIDGKKYLAKVEPHSNSPKGVSVYEPASQYTSLQVTDYSPTKPSTSDGRISLLNRIKEFIKDVEKG